MTNVELYFNDSYTSTLYKSRAEVAINSVHRRGYNRFYQAYRLGTLKAVILTPTLIQSLPMNTKNQRNRCTIVPVPLGIEPNKIKYGTRRTNTLSSDFASFNHQVHDRNADCWNLAEVLFCSMGSELDDAF